MKTKNYILLFLSVCMGYCSFAQTTPITLMGCTSRKGAYNAGTILKYNIGDTMLAGQFNFPSNTYHTGPMSMGMAEAHNGKFYGLNSNDGPRAYGSLYEYDYNTNAYTVKARFDSTGYQPDGSLVLASNEVFYGMTEHGGVNGAGMIFSYHIGDTSVTTLAYMPATASAIGSLIQSTNGKLYGMSNGGGTYNSGTIFQYDTATHQLTTLYNMPQNAYPAGSLLEIGADTLYGMTYADGTNNSGTIFRYIINSGNYTVLHNFDSSSSPWGSLTKDYNNGYVYGLTNYNSAGSLFIFNIRSPVFTTLHYFGGTGDGKTPYGSLILTGANKLYGMTCGDGTNNGSSVIFEFDLVGVIYHKRVTLTTTTGLQPNYGRFVEYITAPVVTTMPADTTVCSGSTVSFSSSAQGLHVTARWQVSTDGGVIFSNIQGASGFTYQFTASAFQNGYQYRAIFTTAGGYDTSATATLNVYPVASSSISASSCPGYVSGSHTYFTSGIYIDTIPGVSINGCDSLVTLHLTIFPPATDTIRASACPGGSYAFGANTYTSPGVYRDTLPVTSVTGCDSFNILVLSILPVATGNITAAICPGSSYSFGTQTYSLPGIYRDTIPGGAMNGCDSIATLHLAVLTDSLTAYFTLYPDTTTPHLWYAVNQCYGTSLSYIWNWGDSSTAMGATPSHTYDSAGFYNICVSVSDSLGCTASYCDTTIYLFKTQSGQIVELNVIDQSPNSINSIHKDHQDIKYYNSSVHFSEAIVAPVQLRLYDLSGRSIIGQDRFSGSEWHVNTGIAQGVYIIQLQNGNSSLSRKIMITQ